jgi:hypothetical protein
VSSSLVYRYNVECGLDGLTGEEGTFSIDLLQESTQLQQITGQNSGNVERGC